VSDPVIDTPETPIEEIPEVPEEPVIETPEVPEPPLEDPNIENPEVPVIDAPETPIEEIPEVPEEPVEIDPTGIISAVSIDGVPGVFLAGAPPEQVGSIVLAPLSDEGEQVQFISGGSTQVALESDTPFITVFVVVDDEGYFQLTLPEALSAADLIISFSTIQIDGELDEIAVSVEGASGAVSGSAVLPVSSVTVGTGEVQVSVSWDTPTDVDLHLIEPDGTRIFFANETSDFGGMLDLDSNPGCFIDGVNNENITYESGTPPSGEYIVEVDYFSNCGITTETNFVVTVRIGTSVETFSGTFVAADDNGLTDEITRFQIP